MKYLLVLAFGSAALAPLKSGLAQKAVVDTPVVQSPSHDAPDFPTITILGPAALVLPVLEHFGVNPVAIDTANGHRVSLRYVDGPYSRLSEKQQSAKADVIARFVWHLPGRPVGTDTLSVSFERPMRTMGESGIKREWIFSKAMFMAR